MKKQRQANAKLSPNPLLPTLMVQTVPGRIYISLGLCLGVIAYNLLEELNELVCSVTAEAE